MIPNNNTGFLLRKALHKACIIAFFSTKSVCMVTCRYTLCQEKGKKQIQFAHTVYDDHLTNACLMQLNSLHRYYTTKQKSCSQNDYSYLLAAYFSWNPGPKRPFLSWCPLEASS